MIDYIVVGIICVCLGLVVTYIVKRKKSGQTGCGCSCGDCPSSSSCHTNGTN